MKFNGFIATLLATIIFAYFFPEGPELFPLSTISNIGIGFIFLFYGIKLSPAQFRIGFANYRSHILIQLSTFVLFPLLVMLCLPLFEGGSSSDLWISLFFLAALPSTVSSSIVMVSLAKGNIPTAIFNASLSGLIGIVATPLWLGIFLNNTGEAQFMDILLKLFLQIILPLAVGLLLQKFLGGLARKYSSQLSLFDKAVILLIVYTSFSTSFASNLFSVVDTGDILKLFFLILALFFAVYFSLGIICKALNFSTEDTITARFCGTKKSLVHGSVMVKVIFGNSASLGLMLLPIMLYHTLQLLVIAVFAESYRKRTGGNPEISSNPH